MKITKVSMIDASELEEAVELQFGLEPGSINLVDLYGEECENDSYQVLDFSDSEIECVQDELDCLEQHNCLEEANEFRHKLLVLIYLRDILPGENKVLWLCSW